MVVDTFYENVEDRMRRIRWCSSPHARASRCWWPACGRTGRTRPKEPDLLSFAAITDDPEPEVAAAGHDRSIINIKPEHVGAWLNPDPANLEALYRIFDDKRHPFYEHRLAA